MDDGRDCVRNFYFAACVCIPLQPHLALFNQPKALVDSGSDHAVITTPKDICVQNDWKTGGEHSDVIWWSLSSLKGWGRESIRGASSCVLCLCF
jgi:hypothetical protein